ncbi:MAG: PEP-CTERM sorting domain-containing protein [Gammaproteobacteria bacterium]
MKLSVMRRLVLVAMLVGIPIANAVTTVPAGLNPGDQYRLAFVTSATRDAVSTNVADYNSFVTGVASTSPDLLALGTNWAAIVTTSSVSARDNTSTNPTVATGVPIYLLNGSKVAESNADLWDGLLDSPLDITELGNAIAPSTWWVWTGTLSYGTIVGSTHLGSDGLSLAYTGITSFSAYQWIEGSISFIGEPNHFYAISDTLTVQPVPVPPAAWLFGSALGVMGWMRRKTQP